MTLLRFVPYVMRTALRARARSALTVLGAALALAIFAFVRTLEGGVERLAAAADAPVLVVFQASRFCPLTSRLPERYRAEIEAMPGVAAVLPTLLYVNQCRSNLDLVTLHGVTTDPLDAVHGLVARAGDLGALRTDASAALVGERLAERRGLHVGDRARLGNVDARVAAIVHADGPGLDNVAFVPLLTLQKARRIEGRVTQYYVRVAPGADAVALARAIDERFRPDEAPTDTKTLQAFVQGAVGEVAGLVSFARWLGWLAVGVVVLVLGNTVFISAQGRAREFGTLETLGLPRGSVAALLTLESVLLAVAGGAIGAGAVALAFTLHPTTLGIEGVGIDFAGGPRVFFEGLVAAVVVGLAAAVVPAVAAVRRPTVVGVKAA